MHSSCSAAEALRAWDDLPPALGQVLAWGSRQPDLAGALRFAGEMFEARAESQSKLAAQTLAGLLLIVIFWLVCFAVAAIYLPLQQVMRMFAARYQSARLPSVVLPCCTQTVAPSSCAARLTPASLRTMKPWPS